VVKEKHEERLLKDCETLVVVLCKELSKDNLTHENQIETSKILSSFSESLLKNLNSPQPLLFNLADYYCKFSNRIGEISNALTASKTMKSVAKRLIKKFQKEEDFKALLALSYSSIAEAYNKQGEYAKAISFHEKNLNQLEKIDKPKLEKFNDDIVETNLSVTKNKLGILYREIGSLEKASELQLESLGHAELLPNNLQNSKKRKLVACKELGHINIELGRKEEYISERNLCLDKAKGYAEECRRFSEELNDSNPDKVDYRNDIASSYQLFGLVHKELGNFDTVIHFFTKANQESMSICIDYPDDLQLSINLARSHVNLACFYRDCVNDKMNTKHHFEIAKSKYEEIQLKFGNEVDLQSKIDELEEILSKL